MDGITYDQLNDVFGDFARKQDSQTSVLQSIETLIGEKFAQLTDKYLFALKSNIEQLTGTLSSEGNASAAATDELNNATDTLVHEQKEQVKATVQLDKNVTSGFKALRDTFLTKTGSAVVDRNKRTDTSSVIEQELRTKQEKLSLLKLTSLDTKIGSLLKEVQSQKTDKQSQGGLFKYLSPFLLLFGGITALTYGAMKIPGVKNLFEGIKKGGIKNTLSNLISKIKPQDKTISEWLRSLPFVGRFFDVYDAFKAFLGGRWKEGFKHLAFAIPGAELFAEILGGKGAKQRILQPGGLTNVLKGVTLEGIWTNIKTLVTNAFKSISDSFTVISDVFKMLGTGDEKQMINAFDVLASYFPALSPVASVLNSFTEDVFKSSFAQKAQQKLGTTNIKFGDIVQQALDNVYSKVSDVFKSIGHVFGIVFDIVSALGDVFSDDYGKQSIALNQIDKISPGTSSMLRQILTITDEFKNLGITDQDDFMSKIWKVTKAGARGSIKSVSKYGRSATLKGAAEEYMNQAEASTDLVKKTELQTNASKAAAEYSDIISKQAQDATDRYEQISKGFDKAYSGLVGKLRYGSHALIGQAYFSEKERYDAGIASEEAKKKMDEARKLEERVNAKRTTAASIYDTGSILSPDLEPSKQSTLRTSFESLEPQEMPNLLTPTPTPDNAEQTKLLQQMRDQLAQLVTNQKQANDHLDDIKDFTEATSQKDFSLKNTNNTFNSISNPTTIYGANTQGRLRGGRWKLN